MRRWDFYCLAVAIRPQCSLHLEAFPLGISLVSYAWIDGLNMGLGKGRRPERIPSPSAGAESYFHVLKKEPTHVCSSEEVHSRGKSLPGDLGPCGACAERRVGKAKGL